MLSNDLISRARKLSSATVHEAYKRRGELPHSITPLTGSMHLAGRALPVRCPAGDNLFLHRAMAVAEPGDVLVVECGPDGQTYGYWGEIMATSAQARGVAGLVISGGVRDSQRIIQLGHPTFCGCVTIRGTNKDPSKDGAVGEPVRLGETVVRSGDLIIGDADGVVAVKKEHAEKIVADSEARDEAEVQIMEKLRGGALTIDVYNFDV